MISWRTYCARKAEKQELRKKNFRVRRCAFKIFIAMGDSMRVAGIIYSVHLIIRV